MTAEQIRKYALSLPGATESIKWGHDLCFSVGDKMFFVIDADGRPTTGSFKTTPEHFDELSEKNGFKPAPYLAKHMWIYFETLDLLPIKQWKYFVELSYELVFDKLPARTKKAISESKGKR
jgi:predicted DNA-binding protein (MmcQ/YjbR family)